MLGEVSHVTRVRCKQIVQHCQTIGYQRPSHLEINRNTEAQLNEIMWENFFFLSFYFSIKFNHHIKNGLDQNKLHIPWKKEDNQVMKSIFMIQKIMSYFGVSAFSKTYLQHLDGSSVIPDR